jgi:hypothetical protein
MTCISKFSVGVTFPTSRAAVVNVMHCVKAALLTQTLREQQFSWYRIQLLGCRHVGQHMFAEDVSLLGGSVAKTSEKDE